MIKEFEIIKQGKSIKVKLPSDLEWNSSSPSYQENSYRSYWTIINNKSLNESWINDLKQKSKENIFEFKIFNKVFLDKTVLILENIENIKDIPLCSVDKLNKNNFQESFIFVLIDKEYCRVIKIGKLRKFINPYHMVFSIIEFLEDGDIFLRADSIYSISLLSPLNDNNERPLLFMNGIKADKLWSEGIDRVLKKVSYDESLVKEDILWEVEDMKTIVNNYKDKLFHYISKKNEEAKENDEEFEELGVFIEMITKNFLKQFNKL